MQTKRFSQLESDTDLSTTHDFWEKTAGLELQGEALSSGDPALLPAPCWPDMMWVIRKGGEAQRHRPKVTDLTLHVGRLPGDLGAKRAWWGREAQQSKQWPAPQGSWAGGSAWSQGWHSRVWKEGPAGYGSE